MCFDFQNSCRKSSTIPVMEELASSADDQGRKTRRYSKWKHEEDEKIRQHVIQYGLWNWSILAEKLEGRTGKSCRLRWLDQLDPRVIKEPFTEEEDKKLLVAQSIHGNKWSNIAKSFPGRTNNALKNHWHYIMGQKEKECHKRTVEFFSNSSSASSLRIGNLMSSYDKERIIPANSLLNLGSMTSSSLHHIGNSPSSKKGTYMFNNSSESSNTLGRNHSSHSSFGSFQGSIQVTLPNYNSRVVVPSHYGNLDSTGNDGGLKRDVMNFCDNSPTMTKLTASSSSGHKQEQIEESSDVERNEVPFIDFLGVGDS